MNASDSEVARQEFNCVSFYGAIFNAESHPLGSSTFHQFFNLLEKAKVSAGAGFKRFLAKVGSSPISHPSV